VTDEPPLLELAPDHLAACHFRGAGSEAGTRAAIDAAKRATATSPAGVTSAAGS
jgi:hypothetical protein